MESSILTSTKNILGLSEEYTPFDLSIVTFINQTFAKLTQLGVGPDNGFFIEDETTEWEEVTLTPKMLNFVKTFVFLEVKRLFDPPGTSFLGAAVDKQIDEFVWRISVQRDEELAA